MARATGREHDVDGTDELDLTVGTQCEHARAALPLDEQLDREPTFPNLDRVADVPRLDQRALDLRSGRIAARVHDPRERMASLAGEKQLRTLR